MNRINCLYCGTTLIPDPLQRAGGRWRFCPVCEPAICPTPFVPDHRGAPSRPGATPPTSS